ncbi:actin-binding protein IPP [Takifugu rubripes]|uniref:Intracisternal A particle-promoted polypeptide n=2 Tax=Takifugu TaxID=31032 RepID=A0A3B5K7X3_TAKRU|nr:actin-binding protein IPP [Takifugu rubripes]XP_056911897.1 actin-binding protein IPP [Takifugu flavidus]XP_056911898.1 actin-binding protein IPP [Takifugu flavidus]TWW72790.1 Actin-binding protein IPP [Takifugu flavidus]|eukprot:XP_003975812.1 PREDICTED: actin-binding protein IPP [Takifugu rubripes]
MSCVSVSPSHCCSCDAATANQASDQSLLSSDRYARLILAQINKMRLCSDFCDVRLKVGSGVFRVHRLVLAASSPYFSALFSGGMSEVDQEEVQILGVETQVFEVLLDFIYTGMISVTVDNVQELMVAADMLQLQEVVTVCGEFLKGHMDPSNCVGIFQFLEQIACMDMLEFTENYIHVHFLEVCTSDDFRGLSKDQLVKILRSEELRIEDEYQVFTAAMDWVLHDVPKRKKHIVEVLEPVRFPLLSPQRLFKYIESMTDFSLRVALQTLLKEYTEVTKSPKENKTYSLLQPAKMRPRRKARKYLYAIGGYTRLQGGRWSDSRALSCVERFDTFNQYWTTVSSIHQARSGLGVAVLEGMIYVVGGEKDSMIFDCTERYDPVTKQWASVASLNFPRCGVGVCPCHGALYALGGWIGSEIGKTMERYDPEENKWEVIGTMAVPRYYFGCCELQGFIYVIGGISDEGMELRSAEAYDPISRRWSALPVMVTRRAYAGVACLNNCIYAVGGWNEALGALETVEKYCPEEEKWVEVAPMSTARAGVSVSAVNGFLYAVGGRAASRDFSAPVTVDSVEIYDPHLDTWTEVGNMITSRCDGGLAVL